MSDIEPRDSLGSNDSERFVIQAIATDMSVQSDLDCDSSDTQPFQQRALSAEARVRDLEAQLRDSSVEFETTMSKTSSEKESMKKSISQLQRECERLTSERHRLLFQEDESLRGRCKNLEEEVTMYRKYVRDLEVANSANQENVDRRREYQEVLEQQVTELEREKQELTQQVTASQLQLAAQSSELTSRDASSFCDHSVLSSGGQSEKVLEQQVTELEREKQELTQQVTASQLQLAAQSSELTSCDASSFCDHSLLSSGDQSDTQSLRPHLHEEEAEARSAVLSLQQLCVERLAQPRMAEVMKRSSVDGHAVQPVVRTPSDCRRPSELAVVKVLSGRSSDAEQVVKIPSGGSASTVLPSPRSSVGSGGPSELAVVKILSQRSSDAAHVVKIPSGGSASTALPSPRSSVGSGGPSPMAMYARPTSFKMQTVQLPAKRRLSGTAKYAGKKSAAVFASHSVLGGG